MLFAASPVYPTEVPVPMTGSLTSATPMVCPLAGWPVATGPGQIIVMVASADLWLTCAVKYWWGLTWKIGGSAAAAGAAARPVLARTIMARATAGRRSIAHLQNGVPIGTPTW